MATALYSLTMTIGVTLASATTVPLANALGGWRAAFAAWVVAAAAALLCWLPLLGQRNPSAPTNSPGSPSARSRAPGSAGRSPSSSGSSPRRPTRSSALAAERLPLRRAGRGAGRPHARDRHRVGIIPAFLIPAYAARTRNPSVLFVSLMVFLVAGYLGLMLAPDVGPMALGGVPRARHGLVPAAVGAVRHAGAHPVATAALTGSRSRSGT